MPKRACSTSANVTWASTFSPSNGSTIMKDSSSTRTPAASSERTVPIGTVERRSFNSRGSSKAPLNPLSTTVNHESPSNSSRTTGVPSSVTIPSIIDALPCEDRSGNQLAQKTIATLTPGSVARQRCRPQTCQTTLHLSGDRSRQPAHGDSRHRVPADTVPRFVWPPPCRHRSRVSYESWRFSGSREIHQRQNSTK